MTLRKCNWLAVGALTILFGACSGEGTEQVDGSGEQGETALAACGEGTGWDSDGDDVSDAVELGNPEYFRAGRCDADPSTPRGRYDEGSLESGLGLPDAGTGYVNLSNSSGSGDFATLALLGCIEIVGRDLGDVGKIGVGDLSRPSGGEFQPHVSHHNGLEVDVAYPRKDRRSEPFDIRQEPEAYDAVLTQEMLKTFGRLCDVEAVFADTGQLKFPVGPGTPFPYVMDHPHRRTHFLVRLKSPEAA